MHNIDIPLTSKSDLVNCLQIVSLHPNLYTAGIIQQLSHDNSFQTVQDHLLAGGINEYALHLFIVLDAAHQLQVAHVLLKADGVVITQRDQHVFDLILSA